MCVLVGGSGSDSRQRGSVMAGYWIRLQPVLPQYVQYNVPLCSPAACPAHICSRGPSCLEDHNHDKNTPTKITHGASEVHTHTAWAGKPAPIHLARRGLANMKPDKVGKQTAGGHKLSLFTFFLLPLLAPSAFLTISAHRWLQPFEVNAGQLQCCH